MLLPKQTKVLIQSRESPYSLTLGPWRGRLQAEPGRLLRETAPGGGAHRPGTRAQACARNCMHALPAQQWMTYPRQRGAFLIVQLCPRHCSGGESTLDGWSSPRTTPQAATEEDSTLQATGGKRRGPPSAHHPGSPCRGPHPSTMLSPLLCASVTAAALTPDRQQKVFPGQQLEEGSSLED